MNSIEIFLVLFLCMAIAATLAPKLKIPVEIVLLLGSLIISFVPGLPEIKLQPDLVFNLFLPPILFSAAFFTSLRDFRANIRSISLLAIGLVLFTICIVAVTAKWLIPAMPWAICFLLGAIISPPDASAAVTITSKLNAPRRMITIIAGESLVNDATALIVYRLALIAALTSTFSFWSASINFFIVALGGILLGYIVGYISTKLFARLYDEKAQVIITLIIPYTAYLLAEQIGVSAVIATVTAGLYFSRYYAQKSTVETRQNGEAIWSMLIFVINGIIFTSIGLELHFIIKQLSGYTFFDLFKYILVICGVVIAARLIWIFPSAYLPRYLFPKIRKRDPYPSWKSVVLVGWTGMRGIVSLAAVLALPEYINNSHPFPYKDLLIFITYCVILVTLLLPTLTLPILMKILHVKDGGENMREEALARLRTTEAVLNELNSLVPLEYHKNPYFMQLNDSYTNRIRTLRTNLQDIAYSEISPLDQQKRQVGKNILKIERQVLNVLRINGEIHDEVFQRLLRELDLEDLRLKTQRI